MNLSIGRVRIICVTTPPGRISILDALAVNRFGEVAAVIESSRDIESFLSGVDDKLDCPRLIIIDRHLGDPEVLFVIAAIRSHRKCGFVPIVALASNNEEKSVRTWYDLGVNSVIPRPAAGEDLSVLIGKLGHYWLGDFSEDAKSP
jgi:CheY-like chemotaxis protein